MRLLTAHIISGTTTGGMQNCSSSLKNTSRFMTSSKACLNHPAKITALQFQKRNPVHWSFGLSGDDVARTSQRGSHPSSTVMRDHIGAANSDSIAASWSRHSGDCRPRGPADRRQRLALAALCGERAAEHPLSRQRRTAYSVAPWRSDTAMDTCECSRERLAGHADQCGRSPHTPSWLSRVGPWLNHGSTTPSNTAAMQLSTRVETLTLRPGHMRDPLGPPDSRNGFSDRPLSQRARSLYTLLDLGL